MGTDETLKNLQAELLDRISAAASNRDITLVACLSGLANECETLGAEARAFQRRVDALARAVEEFTAAEHPPANLKPGVDLWKALSPKAEGVGARQGWLQELESTGISLMGHGKRYRTAGGLTVSIGFANELAHLKGRWWLGFRDEQTDIAVFLCHPMTGQIHAFVVPVSELGPSWNALSRSRGQIKFNVKKDGTRFLLLIPGNEPVDITHYDRHYASLKDAAV